MKKRKLIFFTANVLAAIFILLFFLAPAQAQVNRHCQLAVKRRPARHFFLSRHFRRFFCRRQKNLFSQLPKRPAGLVFSNFHGSISLLNSILPLSNRYNSGANKIEYRPTPELWNWR